MLKEAIIMKKELRRRKYNDEVDSLHTLMNVAQDFELACRLRAYVAAVESKPVLDEETLAWISWAKGKADWIDPTVAANDPIFGKRKHGAETNKKTPEKILGYYY